MKNIEINQKAMMQKAIEITGSAEGWSLQGARGFRYNLNFSNYKYLYVVGDIIRCHSYINPFIREEKNEIITIEQARKLIKLATFK